MTNRNELSTRILLFTGKGGVGKTTVAAATALRCADEGLRTIVLSTDPAHSLADAFDAAGTLDSTPRRVDGHPNLHAQQLDATERLEETWGDVQRYLVTLLDWSGAGAIEAWVIATCAACICSNAARCSGVMSEISCSVNTFRTPG